MQYHADTILSDMNLCFCNQDLTFVTSIMNYFNNFTCTLIILYIGLGDMAQKIITIIIFTSVDIDNYHDKCQIFISFKFKARFLLQSESFRNQTINFP